MLTVTAYTASERTQITARTWREIEDRLEEIGAHRYEWGAAVYVRLHDDWYFLYERRRQDRLVQVAEGREPYPVRELTAARRGKGSGHKEQGP